MPLITIVGAGAGLGLEIARAFGREGFAVALVSRDQAKLDGLAATLGSEGVTAQGFAADIRDAASVTRALDAVVAQLGPIDVLEFSPADPSLESVDVLEVTPANLQPQIDFYLGGALTAVGHVLPAMIEAGRGTVLITTGGGSISPLPFLGNVNIAAAGLRNWTLNLHAALAPKGVYVAHVGITALIGGGHPDAAPKVIARRYTRLHAERTDAELHHVAYDG